MFASLDKKQKFSLIVSNPPGEISQTKRIVYRDGGSDGMKYLRKVIKEVSSYMNTKGECHIMARLFVFGNKNLDKTVKFIIDKTIVKASFLELETMDYYHYAYATKYQLLNNYTRFTKETIGFIKQLQKNNFMYVSYGILKLTKSNQSSYKIKRQINLKLSNIDYL